MALQHPTPTQYQPTEQPEKPVELIAVPDAEPAKTNWIIWIVLGVLVVAAVTLVVQVVDSSEPGSDGSFDRAELARQLRLAEPAAAAEGSDATGDFDQAEAQRFDRLSAASDGSHQTAEDIRFQQLAP